MKSNNRQYIVRGTGSNLDGSIVTLRDDSWDNGYVSVIPISLEDEQINYPIRLHEKCLQVINNIVKYDYKINITKIKNGIEEETVSRSINDSFRNVSPNAIFEFIDLNISPILRGD